MNIEDIQIINENGDSILAEGIANIKYTGNNKTYLMYTFNEKVMNEKNGEENTKIYIAQTGENPDELAPIEADEWQNIVGIIKSISRKEERADIEYLPMTGTTLNVNKPKKLGINFQVKQAIKDSHAMHILDSQGKIEKPITDGNPVFFNQEVVGQPEEALVQDNQPNIFDNPMTPEATTQAPAESPLIDQGSQGTPAPVPTPLEVEPQFIDTAIPQVSANEGLPVSTGALDETSAFSPSVEPPVEETPVQPVEAPVEEVPTEAAPVVETAPVVESAPVQEEAPTTEYIDTKPVEEAEVVDETPAITIAADVQKEEEKEIVEAPLPVEDNEPKITDEEAAMIINEIEMNVLKLQKYIKQSRNYNANERIVQSGIGDIKLAQQPEFVAPVLSAESTLKIDHATLEQDTTVEDTTYVAPVQEEVQEVPQDEMVLPEINTTVAEVSDNVDVQNEIMPQEPSAMDTTPTDTYVAPVEEVPTVEPTEVVPTVEVAPAEQVVEETMIDTMPTPVTEAPMVETASVMEAAPTMDTVPAMETPVMEAAPVVETPVMEAAPVMETMPVAEAPVAPVAEENFVDSPILDTQPMQMPAPAEIVDPTVGMSTVTVSEPSPQYDASTNEIPEVAPVMPMIEPVGDTGYIANNNSAATTLSAGEMPESAPVVMPMGQENIPAVDSPVVSASSFGMSV